MKPTMHKGKLTVWKDAKGFGFIKPENGGQEVFIHITALKDSPRRPKVGDAICYQIAGEKNGKIRATDAFLDKPSSQATLPTLPLAFKAFFLYLLPLWGTILFALKTFNPLPLIIYPLMSIITFRIYAEDKSRAKKGQWRISEATLHMCELAGGWLGAFIAQQKLRHKSKKASYQVVFWIIVALHMVFWVDWLFLGANLMKLMLTQSYK